MANAFPLIPSHPRRKGGANMQPDMPSWRIAIRGTVQGVGFRPFVKRLADRNRLSGSVYNTGDGVIVELECAEGAAREFAVAIEREKPALAVITECRVEASQHTSVASAFVIEPSRPVPGSFTLISPDIAVCPDCLAEMHDPEDRRFGYAFTNCTNCGPRYTIVRQTPYDRPNTTMAPFVMCAACEAEYRDPADRRFHAEPTACPACGPQLSEPIGGIVAALAAGEIVAIKGLGGFQLACDAFSESACNRLRERKRKSRKPFAVMMRDAATVEQYCVLRAGERSLLVSRAAPIVLLDLRDGDGRRAFPDALAPGLDRLGVMLPYTPMHHQLFEGPLECLVMTSGNAAEEPIVIDNAESRVELAEFADRFLFHDRDIFMRADDSVARWLDGAPRMIRRARGYAPTPIDLGIECDGALGAGGELKNTFCLTRGRYAILSQHIGDFENLETQQFFEETLRNLTAVYRASPKIIGHDLHPDYLSTRWALGQPQPKIAVQHHHAHIASCMAENGVTQPVIGVAWDGTGYGADGQIWGGEFLICDFTGFRRAAHLRYVPLVGGDQAARQPWRSASAYLYDAFGEDDAENEAYRAAMASLQGGISDFWWKIHERLLARPPIRTSSAGRLFDAVAALTGICFESTFEGEAAMLLESEGSRDADASKSASEEVFPFDLDTSQSPWVIDTRPIIRNVAAQCFTGHSRVAISQAFHRTLGHIIRTLSVRLREETGLNTVCLSGGTFQNAALLAVALPLLRAEGFEVFQHSRVPANDGGLSLGQAVVAAAALRTRR